MGYDGELGQQPVAHAVATKASISGASAGTLSANTGIPHLPDNGRFVRLRGRLVSRRLCENERAHQPRLRFPRPGVIVHRGAVLFWTALRT
jgi:hypothetical protein